MSHATKNCFFHNYAATSQQMFHTEHLNTQYAVTMTSNNDSFLDHCTGPILTYYEHEQKFWGLYHEYSSSTTLANVLKKTQPS